MPQTLDVISINVWNILLALANLVILFLLFKRFLFKPVKKLFADRQAAIDGQYAAADAAKAEAEADREAWQQKRDEADEEADRILREAAERADDKAKSILQKANEQAEQITERARAEAELERRRAADGIKREIVEGATALAEKMLEREVREEDHRAMIDSFIDEMGADHDTER